MNGKNYLDAQARLSGRGTMADVDDSPLARHYRELPRELPYDRERRERRSGRLPVLLVFGVIVAIAVLAYWLRHR